MGFIRSMSQKSFESAKKLFEKGGDFSFVSLKLVDDNTIFEIKHVFKGLVPQLEDLEKSKRCVSSVKKKKSFSDDPDLYSMVLGFLIRMRKAKNDFIHLSITHDEWKDLKARKTVAHINVVNIDHLLPFSLDDPFATLLSMIFD